MKQDGRISIGEIQQLRLDILAGIATTDSLPTGTDDRYDNYRWTREQITLRGFHVKQFVLAPDWPQYTNMLNKIPASYKKDGGPGRSGLMTVHQMKTALEAKVKEGLVDPNTGYYIPDGIYEPISPYRSKKRRTATQIQKPQLMPEGKAPDQPLPLPSALDRHTARNISELRDCVASLELAQQGILGYLGIELLDDGTMIFPAKKARRRLRLPNPFASVYSWIKGWKHVG